MGKPVKHSRNEVANAAAQVKFFCQKAEDWLAPEEATTGFVEYDPLGVIAVISPLEWAVYRTRPGNHAGTAGGQRGCL